MLNLRYSWRNLWRNKRRSLINLTALTVNTAVLIATFALVTGYIDNSIKYVTNLNLGEVQVHFPGYLEDNSIYKRIENPDKILETASSLGIDASPRMYGYGLLSSGNKSAGVLFQGTDSKRERATFTLAQHMMSGDFLSQDKAGPAAHNPDDVVSGEVVLGKKLARTLDAELGTELVAVIQAADGSLGTGLFTVAGILQSAGDKLDRSTAMIHMSDFRAIFVIPEGVHEIAFSSHGRIGSAKVKAQILPSVSDLEVKTWEELNPVIAQMLEMSHVSFNIMAAIFITVAGLGIMNTMLMATFDRIREFGILKALGATPMRILVDIISEAFLMGFLATLLGVLIGISGTMYLQTHGIDTSGLGTDISWAGIAFDPIWKAKLTWDAVSRPVVMMWIVSVVSALYPAIIAARLKPVEAMHHV